MYLGSMLIDPGKRRGVFLLPGRSKSDSKLIELTMLEIDHENFIGIEVETYPQKSKSFLSKILGKKEGRLTVIGPANRLKTLEKKEDIIKALIE